MRSIALALAKAGAIFIQTGLNVYVVQFQQAYEPAHFHKAPKGAFVFICITEIRRYTYHMKCPIDNTALLLTDRQGIEIDYCPTCRGVWLDRGELDKIIDRGAAYTAPVQRPAETRAPEYHHDSRNKHHRKEGFLGELFDF